MKFIRKEEGAVYTPEGHDASVMSRVIYKDIIDVHVTSFPPGAGMEEEIHENLNHVFIVEKGTMEVQKHGNTLQLLNAGDAVFIPAGELHEIKNSGEKEMEFLAITFKN